MSFSDAMNGDFLSILMGIFLIGAILFVVILWLQYFIGICKRDSNLFTKVFLFCCLLSVPISTRAKVS